MAMGVWLVDSVFLTHPTPETQSQFFKSYSPEETMKPFLKIVPPWPVPPAVVAPYKLPDPSKITLVGWAPSLPAVKP